jgi:RNA polymerase sigma-70 factor (ECF subfamily)
MQLGLRRFDRIRNAASQYRSLPAASPRALSLSKSVFSYTYAPESLGGPPAFPVPAMCATSFCFQMDTAIVSFRRKRYQTAPLRSEAATSTDSVTASLDLLARARRGNREALAGLVVPYSSGLYLSALRLTGNPSDAEDVRQEALLRAVSRLDQFAGSRSEARDDFHAWVSRIGSNAAIDVIRRRREGKMVSLEQPSGATEETVGSGIAARQDNPEERLARKEMRTLLASAIVQLPAELRQVCLLQDVLHYSTQEVADRLGVSTVAVRLRLFRARRKLREKMNQKLRQPQARPVRVAPRRAERASCAALPMSRRMNAFAECCGD